MSFKNLLGPFGLFDLTSLLFFFFVTNYNLLRDRLIFFLLQITICYEID